MAPPYDDEYATRTSTPQFALPRITKVVRRLIIANVAVFVPMFIWSITSASIVGFQYKDLERELGVNPSHWFVNAPFVPVWELFTYGFLHDVESAWHILGNMLMLFFFGTMLENKLGARRFFLFYLAAQIAGGLLFLLPVLFGEFGPHVIGASGAVYGVMFAVATLYPNQIVFLFFLPLRMKWLAIGIAGLAVFAQLLAMKHGSDGTAHLVHLGGAAYGFLAVRFGLIEKDPIQMIERKRAVMQVAREADDESRMDRLLEKIHQEGMGSLTRSEKEFLKRMSSRR